jgi:alkanesulfonate monooxygenase SsuD/methylene tetrahydromethanopterin reductase-like flavin-dependent oxidoreductase (luciferase family)
LYCEELGYDSIWFGDHLTTGGSRFEVWTILSALSALTKKIRLGTLVLCNNWRNPALLAKMAATLDVISQGRLEFGIGSGWNQEEHETYGYAFQKPHVRIARMRESLEIMKKLWTEEKPSFDGKYYHIHDVVCDPKPLQKPYPPITIGGGGENLTLKAVAAYADRWNARGLADEYKHKLDLLKKYCARIGRDYNSIDKTYYTSMDLYHTEDALIEAMKELYQYGMERRRRSWDPNWSFDEWLDIYRTKNLIGTPDECLDKIQQFIDIGVTYFIFSIRAARRVPNLVERKESLRLFAEHIINPLKD